MELSLDLIHSILDALRGDLVDKRKHPRAPLRVKLKVLPYKAQAVGKPMDVWLRDLSAGGIGFTTPSPLAVGDRFIVRLQPGAAGQVYLMCVVKNCTEIGRRAYITGCTFSEVARPLNSAAHPKRDLATLAPSASDDSLLSHELTLEILRISESILS